MRGGRATFAALMLALAVGCTSSISGAAAVAAYAEGRWACVMKVPMGPPARVITTRLPITAVVSVHDETSGRVTIDLRADEVRQVRGTWHLDGDRLTVRWDAPHRRTDLSIGPTYGRGIELDADHIRMRGEEPRAPRSGNWVPVDVDRGKGSVSFRFDVGGHRGAGDLTCRKA
jgi:hypothetical protein